MPTKKPRAFKSDINERQFRDYKKNGGKLGPKSWYQRYKDELDNPRNAARRTREAEKRWQHRTALQRKDALLGGRVNRTPKRQVKRKKPRVVYSGKGAFSRWDPKDFYGADPKASAHYSYLPPPTRFARDALVSGSNLVVWPDDFFHRTALKLFGPFIPQGR